MHIHSHPHTNAGWHTHMHTHSYAHNDGHTQMTRTHSRANARAHRHVQATHTHTAKQHAHSLTPTHGQTHRQSHTHATRGSHMLTHIYTHTHTRKHSHRYTFERIKNIHTGKCTHTAHARISVRPYKHTRRTDTHKQTQTYAHTGKRTHTYAPDRGTRASDKYTHIYARIPVSPFALSVQVGTILSEICIPSRFK